MCFECFKSKPAKEWRAIGFNKHLLYVILRISLMRIMKSSETLGDIPEKSMIRWWNFPKYSPYFLLLPTFYSQDGNQISFLKPKAYLVTSYPKTLWWLRISLGEFLQWFTVMSLTSMPRTSFSYTGFFVPHKYLACFSQGFAQAVLSTCTSLPLGIPCNFLQSPASDFIHM